MEKINLYNCIKDLGPVIMVCIAIAIWQSKLHIKQHNDVRFLARHSSLANT